MTRRITSSLAAVALIGVAVPHAGYGKTMTWTNPVLEKRADPHVFLHSDGYYYLTATVPEYDAIELRRAKTIDGLSSAKKKVIWKKHDEGEMGAHIWAPEIHNIDGDW